MSLEAINQTSYFSRYRSLRLTRDANGVLVAELHKDGGPLNFTPDPNGKYVYASVKAGLQVIDTSSLQIVNTVPTGGVIGTPLVLK